MSDKTRKIPALRQTHKALVPRIDLLLTVKPLTDNTVVILCDKL